MAELGEPLSERELAVLELLAEGSTNRQIARELDISPNTVKVHLRNIFTKLGVSSRTEASTVALQKGVLSMPGIAKADPADDRSSEPEIDEAPTVLPPTQMTGQETGQLPLTGRRTQRRLIAYAVLLLFGLTIGALATVLFTEGRGRSDEPPGTGQSFIEQPVAGSNWLKSRPMPQARANMAMASIGLDLYQIAGEVEAGVVNIVNVFETDSRTWHSVASKPTAVADAAAAVLFGEIYVAGGRLADGRPTSVVEAFSPTNNAWRPVSPLPEPLTGGLMLTDGNLLYYFGGWKGETASADSYIYDPGFDRWQPISPMPQARAYSAGGYLDDRFYIVGGRDGLNELATCEVYLVATDSWSDCPSMLSPRSGAGAAVINNEWLYIFGSGGEDAESFGEGFNATFQRWEPVVLPESFEDGHWTNPGVTSVETRIYLSGGRFGDRLAADNYIYVPFVHRTYLPAVRGEG